MAVYRFRIVFEDHEDVYREIDILGKQTYEDFHRAIQESINFDNSKDASFFMSDDLWKKGQEIASKAPDHDDDDDDYPSKTKKDIHVMSKSKIANYIDDPHQRMVYVFDPAAKWTLLIELSKILADDPKKNYPICTKSVGAAPKQYKIAVIPPPIDEEEEEAEDKTAKEKIFTAVEGIDVDEHLGDSEEGEDAPVDSEEAEPGAEEESTEEEAADFDPDAFGAEPEDQF